VTMRHHLSAVCLAVVAVTCVSRPVNASAQTNDAATASAVTVSEVHAAMLKAATAEIRGFGTVVGSSAKPTVSGIARFASRAYDETFHGGKFMLERRIIGDVLYDHTNLFTKTQSWCQTSLSSNYPEITVDQVVFSIKPSNAKPVRIGNQTITNVLTTKYHLSPRNGPAVTYWIDAKDRIVQMKWSSDQGEHDTIVFYNYGAAVRKISAPSHAPQC
jgi:hypothetical protein